MLSNSGTYEFELGHNVIEATKIIYCTKSKMRLITVLEPDG